LSTKFGSLHVPQLASAWTICWELRQTKR